MKWLLLVSLTFIACDDNNNEPVVEVITSGNANFSKFVAIGDSFSAGFSDGALFKKGQENAFPYILAKQFALAGGGEFKTPFMSDDNIGGFSLGGVQMAQFPTRLVFNGVAPVNIPGTSGTSVTSLLVGTFNNYGVPGAKSIHLAVNGYGTLNPYFGRFASSSSASVMQDALAQDPTFFSMWIGGNDVLGYATNGGVPTSQDPILGNDITPTATFNTAYNSLIATATIGGRKGVVANLPYVNTLPFFTTVPFNPLSVSVLGSGNTSVGLATISQLNAQLYGPLKTVLTALGAGDRINLLSTTVNNPMLIKDETLTDLSAQIAAAFTPTLGPATANFYGQVFGKVRQSKNTDYVLLTTQKVIGTSPSGIPAPLDKYGITYPLEDKHILIPSEINEIKVATDAYNATIKSAADSKGLAFFDAAAVMTQLLNGGIKFDNFHMSTSFVVGGAFSLDGIHTTARGNALIANRMLKAINQTYGSNIPEVKMANFQISYPLIIN